MLAAAARSLASVIGGPPRTFEVLGAVPSALYLASGEDVVAVLTPQAVRLPCAVVLGASEDLASMRPDGVALVGGGALSWTRDGRAMRVAIVRWWAPSTVPRVEPRSDRLAELAAALAAVDIAVPPRASVLDLVGRGPGLTPSGDDVVAGWLLGARAFAMAAPPIDELSRTTLLSTALLRCAARGECVPQLAEVVRGLGSARPQHAAIAALVRVGHTSGAALGAGLLRAADALGAVAA